MQTRNLFTLATVTLALTGTVFAQRHPENNKAKTRKAQVQSIKSPRDSASGQATGKTTQVQPGQNSGGTTSSQRRKQPVPKLTGYTNGGIEQQDSWETNGAAKRTATSPRQDKYANQEVGYRQAKGNEVAVESLEKSNGAKTQSKAVVFEPNNEPLWAKAKRRANQPRAKTSPKK